MVVELLYLIFATNQTGSYCIFVKLLSCRVTQSAAKYIRYAGDNLLTENVRKNEGTYRHVLKESVKKGLSIISKK